MNTVFDFLKEKGNMYNSGEISDITGIDKKMVDKEIKQLLKEGKISSPKRCFYQAN